MLTLPLRFQTPPPLSFVRYLTDRAKGSPSPPGRLGTTEALLRAKKNSGPFRKSVRDKARKDHEFSGQR